jgi:hypothetical protein
MGGKALNKYGVHTERKNTEEFNQIRQELIFKIAFDLGIYSNVVKCYHTKADHGDLDLLMQMSPDKNVNWREYIQKAFNPQAIHNNGGVFSFDYKNFQVDIIPIKEDKWKIANVYYSYDPLGNIMGKTFHKFGLSYGWDGLHYKYRNFRGTNSENILLSTDPKRIFEFGGYNYNRYLQGFETLEDIFEFAVDCVNFDTEIFQMENLKSIDKKRNRKRGSYHLFLKYLKDNDILISKDFETDKSNYITAIDYYFPEAKLWEKLEELQDKDRVDKYMSQKFNGDIVMAWLPNLQGKELGAAISKFKNHFASEDNFRTFVIDSDYETIRRNFMRIYNGKD